MYKIWDKSNVVGVYYMCRVIRRERRVEVGDISGDNVLSFS